MEPSKKRAKKADKMEANDDCHEPFVGQNAPSPNLVLSDVLARISQLEECHRNKEDTISQLQDQVVQLQERVTQLETQAIRAEDRDYDPSRQWSVTVRAVREGKTTVLAERLRRGADPNQDDPVGGPCLMHSVQMGRPECTRLLIEYGADVTYCFHGDNASLLFTLVTCLVEEQERPLHNFRPGDLVLTADLLVEAGAPIHEVYDGDRMAAVTALPLLYWMEEREGTRRDRERRGLIDVLEHRYWRDYPRNPFLGASSEESAWLLLKGAADDDDGHVNMTRVRSIKPADRQAVLDSLLRFQGMRETFVHMILTMRDTNDSASPLCLLRGHESSILPVIAAFAGSRGWSRRKLDEAATITRDAIQRFNDDGHDIDEEGDEDDDSYYMDEDENDEDDIDEDENDEDEDDNVDAVIFFDDELQDEGDY